MSKPLQKIICGTCLGDGREVSFTGAEFACQSCGGLGSHYEDPNKIRDLKDDIASLRAECDRLTKANTSLQNQLDYAEKVYRANSQSYRDEIAELSATITTTGGDHG